MTRTLMFSFLPETKPPPGSLVADRPHQPWKFTTSCARFDKTRCSRGGSRGVPATSRLYRGQGSTFRRRDRQARSHLRGAGGWNTVETTSMAFQHWPLEEVQIEALRAMPGFAQARIFRPGYAVSMTTSLTSSSIPGDQARLQALRRGPESMGPPGMKAACQGCGWINAHLALRTKDPFILKRDEAYIGGLFDDDRHVGAPKSPIGCSPVVRNSRILLRQDNADLRLTPRSMRWDWQAGAHVARWS